MIKDKLQKFNPKKNKMILKNKKKIKNNRKKLKKKDFSAFFLKDSLFLIIFRKKL